MRSVIALLAALILLGVGGPHARAGARASRHARRHHRGFDRSGFAWRHRHGHRHRGCEQGGSDRAGKGDRSGRRDDPKARARTVFGTGRIFRVRNTHAAGRSRQKRQQQASADAAGRRPQGNRPGRPGQAGRRRRSARIVVRHDADARAAREFVRRSRSAAPAVDGHGRPRRGDPRRQLRRRGAAEQVADSIDSHLARSVRRGIPRGGRHQRRDHHAAGHGADADERELSPARRRVERPQPVRAGTRAGEQSQSRYGRRRHADQEQELVQLLHQRRARQPDAEHQHRHARWRAPLRSDGDPEPQRRLQRQFECRLRADHRSNAALRP